MARSELRRRRPALSTTGQHSPAADLRVGAAETPCQGGWLALASRTPGQDVPGSARPRPRCRVSRWCAGSHRPKVVRASRVPCDRPDRIVCAGRSVLLRVRLLLSSERAHAGLAVLMAFLLLRSRGRACRVARLLRSSAPCETAPARRCRARRFHPRACGVPPQLAPTAPTGADAARQCRPEQALVVPLFLTGPNLTANRHA